MHAEQRRERGHLVAAPWQAELAPGDVFLRVEGDLLIYCEIWPVGEGPGITLTEAERDHDRWIFDQPHMRNKRNCMCYSAVCPSGELGSVDVRTAVAKSSPEELREARAAWLGRPDVARDGEL
jgi:hypothetical protein